MNASGSRPGLQRRRATFTLPLAGRAADLHRLELSLIRSPPSGVLLRGAPGIGKSRLFRELGDRLEARGRPVERVSGALSTAGVPLGALAGLVPDPQAAGPTDALRSLSLIRTALAEKHATIPVLLVDDAHLLDHISALCLSQLLATGCAVVALAVCSGESLPGPLASLAKDGFVDVTDLGPLRPEDVSALIDRSVDGAIDPPTRHRLQHVAGGNPLYLTEFLAAATETGSLRRDNDGGPFPDLIVPDRLLRLVTTRLGSLDPEVEDGLQALASGEHLELALLRVFMNEEALAELERRRVIRVREDKGRHTVSFEDPLFAETLRTRAPLSRRRSITLCLCRALEATGARRRGDAWRLALWHLQCGFPLDPARLLAAARSAAEGADHHLAERLARAAVAAGAGPDGDIAHAEAVSKQGRIEEAERILRKVMPECRDASTLSRAVLARVENLAIRGSDRTAGHALLEATRARLPDRRRRAALDVMTARLAIAQSDPVKALEFALPVTANQDAPVAARIAAFTVVAQARAWLCDFTACYRAVDDGLSLIGRAGAAHPAIRVELVTIRCVAHMYDGRVAQAEKVLRDEFDRMIESGVHPSTSTLAVRLSTAAAIAGKLDEALEYCRQALSWVRWFDPTGDGLGTTLALNAVTAGMAGDQPAVDELVARLDDGLACIPPSRSRRARARAWQLAVRGQTQQATLAAVDAGTYALEDGNPLVAAVSLYDAVLFGHPGLVVDHLEDIAAEIASPTLRDFAAHSAALDHADPSALEATAASFMERDELLYAFHALTQAACVHRLAGCHTAAARATTKVRALLDRFTGPMPWGLREQPRYLTPRETEIARFAAAGLHSRDIAEQAHISVRTVDNHLASVYTKLGLHSRQELGDVFTSAKVEDLLGV